MSAPKLIMHTVPATPICPEYRALCVDTGARPPPQVAEIDGRSGWTTDKAVDLTTNSGWEEL